MNATAVQLLPTAYGPVPGLGTIQTIFSTYNGAAGPLLYDSAHGNVVSGELRPRAGAAGVYEGGYQQQSQTSVVDFGSYTVNVPPTDADGDGIPDVLQYNQAGNFTATGTAFSAPTGLSFPISIQFFRAANSAVGSYTLTTTSAAGVASSATGNFQLASYSGSISYARGAGAGNSLSFSIARISAGTTPLLGTTSYTTSGDSQLSYAPCTILDASGNSYSVKAGTLTRSGNIYRGTLSLVDGQPQTYWPDFTDYQIVITDPNDADKNGIPDLTDPSAVPAGVTTPVIVTQPVSITVATNATAVFSVVSTGGTTFQWKKNGAAVFAPNSPLLVISGATAANAGSYTCTISNSSGSVTTAAATLTLSSVVAVTGTGDGFGRPLAISTRGNVGTGDNVLIAGFILEGATARTVLVEASGQGLPDPKLELYAYINGANVKIYENDDWGGDQQISNVRAAVGGPPLAPKDSALLLTLQPNVPYTAIMSGSGPVNTGIALIAVYGVP